MSLVPPSITTCPGQTVMFNCTARGLPIRWNVFTTNIKYTNLDINNNSMQVHRESMDGVIMADLIVLDSSIIPITVVSSLTVNVTAELDGSKVQCLGFTANGIDIETQSGFIHITGNYYLHIRHIKDVLPLFKMKEVFFGHNSQGQMGEIHSLKPCNFNTNSEV